MRQISLFKATLAVTAVLFISAVVVLPAHHGWTGYDEKNPLTLSGTVKDSGYENPHGFVDLETPDKVWRVVLAPVAHGRHNRPAGRAYCVLTGWMNAPLDRLEFFGRLERLMAAAGFRWFTRAEWPGTLATGEADK